MWSISRATRDLPSGTSDRSLTSIELPSLGIALPLAEIYRDTGLE